MLKHGLFSAEGKSRGSPVPAQHCCQRAGRVKLPSSKQNSNDTMGAACILTFLESLTNLLLDLSDLHSQWCLSCIGIEISAAEPHISYHDYIEGTAIFEAHFLL